MTVYNIIVGFQVKSRSFIVSAVTPRLPRYKGGCLGWREIL